MEDEGGAFQVYTTGEGLEDFNSFFGRQNFGEGDQKPKHREDRSELFPKDDPSGVVPLGKSKFPDENSKHVWIMIFYENNLTVCAEAKPQFETLAQKVLGTFKTGAVDCKRTNDAMRFCREKRIKSIDLPVYGIVVDGKFTVLERGEDRQPPTMDQIEEFAKGLMPYNLVSAANHYSYATTLTKNALRKNMHGSVLLLNDGNKTTPEFAGLAYQFRHDFIFACDNSKAPSMKKYFNVTKYPVVAALVARPGTKNEYDIEVIHEPKKLDLALWLDVFVAKNGGTRFVKKEASYKKKKKKTIKMD